MLICILFVYMYVIMLVIWFEWSVMGFQKQYWIAQGLWALSSFFIIIIWILLTLQTPSGMFYEFLKLLPCY